MGSTVSNQNRAWVPAESAKAAAAAQRCEDEDSTVPRPPEPADPYRISRNRLHLAAVRHLHVLLAIVPLLPRGVCSGESKSMRVRAHFYSMGRRVHKCAHGSGQVPAFSRAQRCSHEKYEL